MKISIKETKSPAILKFEMEEFIGQNIQFEFANIDEASLSPLAQQLFHLPFVKKVYIAGNFIAIERYNIVEWDDVKNEVAEQIENFINNGGEIIKSGATVQRSPITFYSESTPNPSVMKFVSNKMLTKIPVECKNIEETDASPLAKALFSFSFVKEVYVDENYISISKFNVVEWQEVSNEIRNFIKKFADDGGVFVDESKIVKSEKPNTISDARYESLDDMSQKIISIIDEYVKPAVAADGGNIVFESFNPETRVVKVIMQGACNGCPSSTFTLKNGIESMLRNMLTDDSLVVESY